MTQDNLREALNLGRVAQVGCVVRDLEKTAETYQQTFGIGPFAIIRFKPEESYVRGRAGGIDLKIGIAPLTPELSLELIEVVEGEPYHKDFLEAHGEGVQHLGFVTDDYDGVLRRAEELGIPVLMSAGTTVEGMGRVRGAYLDTLPLTGVLFEVIEINPAG